MRPCLPFSITAMLLFAAATGAPSAATAAPPVPSKTWTADDILLAESAGSFAISPDGQRAVWVKSRDGRGEGRAGLEPLPEPPPSGETARGPAHPWQGPRPRARGGRPTGIDDRLPQHSCASPKRRTKERRSGEDASGGSCAAQGASPGRSRLSTAGSPSFAWKRRRHPRDRRRRRRGASSSRGGRRRRDTAQVVEDAEREPPGAPLLGRGEGRASSRGSPRTATGSTRSRSRPNGRWAVALAPRSSLSFQYDNQMPPVLKLHDLAGWARRGAMLEGHARPRHQRPSGPRTRRASTSSTSYSSHPTYYTATIRAPPVRRRGDGYGHPGGPAVGATVSAPARVAGPPARRLPRPPRRRRALPPRPLRPLGLRLDAARPLGRARRANVFDWALGEGPGRPSSTLHSAASEPDQWYRARLVGATRSRGRPLLDRPQPRLQGQAGRTRSRS